MILYLHGFRSSPQSAKAQQMARAMRERGLEHNWLCPQLPASPAQAIALVRGLIENQAGRRLPQDLTVVGSSLGGYYAAYLASLWECRAVLLNPVVHAARDLATQVGTHTLYHSPEPFVFLPEYIDELACLAFDRPARPERYFLLAASGDEVLDWREMAQWYAGCPSRIINGSDHGITDFERWLPEVMAFALQRTTQPHASPAMQA